MGLGGSHRTRDEAGLQVRDAQCGQRRRRDTGVSVRTRVFARAHLCVCFLSSGHRRAEEKRCLVATGTPSAQILVSSNFTPRSKEPELLGELADSGAGAERV